MKTFNNMLILIVFMIIGVDVEAGQLARGDAYTTVDGDIICNTAERAARTAQVDHSHIDGCTAAGPGWPAEVFAVEQSGQLVALLMPNGALVYAYVDNLQGV